MRIALVEFSPSGGLFQFALQMAEAYAEQGHEVELVTGPNPELVPRVPGVRLQPILPTWHPAADGPESVWIRKPRRALRAVQYLTAWLRLTLHLGLHPPDVLQWAEWRFALDGWMVWLLACWLRRPVLADVAHTPKPFSEQRTSGRLHKNSPLLSRALAAAYRRMDVVFVLGDSARRDLLQICPSLRRVEVIPHGDESIFADGTASPADTTEPVALFFGTLARYKGLEVLLDAWPQVRREVPTARLVVAGSVADVDLGALRRRVSTSSGVELRIGYVPAPQVEPLVTSARVVVAPYVIANQSGVVHLAATLARPVVATDVGDLRLAVVDGETGLLVPPGDPKALAEALVRLLTEPAIARRLGEAGRARARLESSWHQVVNRVLPIYAEFVGRKALG